MNCRQQPADSEKAPHAVGVQFAVVITGQSLDNPVVQSFIQALSRDIVRSDFQDSPDDFPLFQIMM